MAKCDIVLSDKLLKLYLDFKEGLVTNSRELNRVQSLLVFFKPYLTNKRQYDAINKELPKDLHAQLLASSISDDLTELQLASKTRMKLILTENENCKAYPYLCVNGEDRIEINYTGSFKKVLRSKCIAHIKALCETASKVSVYDKYLCKHENFTSGIVDKFFKLFEGNAKIDLEILLPFNAGTLAVQRQELTTWWSMNSVTYSNIKLDHHQVDGQEDFHDRYMHIMSPTGNVEIILSSGFEYLFNDEKDFTYLIRALKK